MTLNINTGDWAVLREGTIEGPMIVKEDTKHTMYPVETGSTCTRSWTIDGKYYHSSETIGVEDDALDIIATLPCPPLERIRQLEAINANLMGDDENAPRYTKKRLRAEIDQANLDATLRIGQLEEALRAIADNEFHANENGSIEDAKEFARRALGESK